MKGTPFSEYREEQTRVNVFDYFVTPSFFDQFCDTKPLLIYGSRGSGKTTLFKALALSEAQDVHSYLEDKKYIGIYYRVDMNVTKSFEGYGVSQEEWHKLFSYYIICALSCELLRQIIKLKELIGFVDERKFAKKYGRLFANKSDINSLDDLKDLIYDEMYYVRDYINNCPYQSYPHIGDYATIILEMPADLLQNGINFNFKDKTIFYLIDEFEGLTEWQQKLVLSLVKYSDEKHTFKICMRPDGLKSAETIGKEFISETDDVKSIDLDDKILSNRDQLYRYALDVCQKRVDLFYKSNGLSKPVNFSLENVIQELSNEETQLLTYKGRETKVQNSVSAFFEEVSWNNQKALEIFTNDYFEFLLFKIMVLKKKKGISINDVWEQYISKDKAYKNKLHNYKKALFYYASLTLSKPINYSGFQTLVDISGGTLRYLLEICNEIFEIAIARNEFSYESPAPISYKIQTEAINEISRKRVGQISAIPQIGLNIRTFIIAFGKICQVYHREERLSKIEPNHFSIKSGTMDDDLKLFLKECVMRGVLVKKKSNKEKNKTYIGADGYLYMLHPIYTPALQISWRRKHKIEFTVDEVKILSNNNTVEIVELVKRYQSKTNTSNSAFPDYEQLEIALCEEMLDS